MPARLGNAATMQPPQRDLTRTILAVLLVGALIALSFLILRPFLPAFVWAMMVVVSTWPLLLKTQARLGGRRWAAVSAMTLALLLVFVVPFSLAIAEVVQHSDRIIAWARAAAAYRMAEPPEWLARVPGVGGLLAEGWNRVVAIGGAELAARIGPYVADILKWFATEVGEFGKLGLQLILTIIFAAILYAEGEAAAAFARAFARRLTGERGERVVRLAGQAIRGVAFGVVLTALVQSLFGGIGLWVAGVPAVALLTAAMFLLAVAQIGAVPVLAVAVAWLYWKDATVTATALLIWTIIVGTMDNVLRPLLIKMGADLPLLLIFAGVIGGLLSMGLVGIFVGPVVLAVTYTLLVSWVEEGPGRD
jgi:predicted PurR-regulated permease PerM